MNSPTAMLRRLLSGTMLALAVAACADRTEKVDEELARDLALANQAPANPQFEDVPLSDIPEPSATKQPSPRPSRTTSRPAPAPRRAPVVEAPRPSPSQPVERTPVIEERSEPAPRGRGISAGTSFGLSTRGQVCTTNLPGDKIVATTTSAVQGDGGVTIPEGTTVVLEVVSVTPGSRPEDAQIALRVRSILVNDQPVSPEASVAIVSALERGEAQGSGSDKKKVIGGAIAGAVIGQVLGRDTRSTVIGAAAGAAAGTAAAAATRKYHACLPAGSSLRVTTTQAIALD